MLRRLAGVCLGTLCLSSLCMTLTPPPVWSASDKTVVDLDRGLPEAPARYRRPRGVQHYRSDKTEVDLAVPLAQSTDGAPQTPPPAAATPGTLLPLTAPPGGGR
ncbi:MAG: hypothetical protein AB7N91_11830 [Candidatus Tectimicrobiota bacterium]